jgi:hypothetical protein
MSKKIVLILTVVLALTLGVSLAWGGVVNFPDRTLIDEFTGFTNVQVGWTDIVGTAVPFDSFNATYDTTSHVLTFYTNWGPGNNTFQPIGPGGPTFATADLFLNYNPTTNTALAAVELFGPAGTTSNTVHYNPTTITTSADLFGPGKTAGIGIDYGKFYTTNIAPAIGPPSYLIPVSASGGTTGSVNVTWTANPADPFPPPATTLWSFSLDLDDITGLNVNNFDFLYATSTCGNDVLLAAVPLPPSLLLLGSGLLGLGALGFRRKSKVL